MTKIARFVLWLCNKFTRQELEEIIRRLQEILAEREPQIKPRDDFHDQHPHYRQFYVDPLAPLTEPTIPAPTKPILDWKRLCADYAQKKGRALDPVIRRKGETIPKGMVCLRCGAPAAYLYLNNGQNATQVRCKICPALSQIPRTRRKNQKTVFWCPYCHWALYRWKHPPGCTIYKCDNDA